MNFPNGSQIGWVADDVLNVVPELVTRDKEGYLYVSYSHAVALIGQAVTELSERVDTIVESDVKVDGGKNANKLEERVKEMQREIAAKDNRIAALENSVSSLAQRLEEMNEQMKLLTELINSKLA